MVTSHQVTLFLKYIVHGNLSSSYIIILKYIVHGNLSSSYIISKVYSTW